MKRIAARLLSVLFVIACSMQPQPQPKIVAVTATVGGGGIIRGQVHLDGNPLPGVTVTLAGASPRNAISDVNGNYKFEGVSAGIYQVTFSLAGMQTVTRTVTITSTSGADVSANLKLAGMSESITVTAAAPSVLETNSISSNFSTAAGYDNVYMVGGTMVPENLKGTPHTAPTSSAPPPPTPEPQPSAEQYATIIENTFIQTKAQATTTFSIDVDGAAYANVRRFLNDNQRPPKNAIRIEEMINYFPYHYAPPTDGRPFGVTSEVAGCPWEPAHRLVRIGVHGMNLDQWKMAPNNLVFLLDVSGSMQTRDRLELLKSAFHLLVDQLRGQDTVSIVVYAGAAGVVLPPTSGADKDAINNALTRLQAGGSTAGGQGIELAYKTAQDSFLPDGNNRVILATDGDFNVGVTNPGQLTKLIEEKRKLGIYLTCLGVGRDNLNDALMESLADKGNGNYFYLDTIKEAEKVFVRELAGTLVTIAKDVKVQLEFDPAAVASYRQIGYEDRALANRDFDDDSKDAGELGSGHTVTALYEIAPAPGAPLRGQIASLKLRYKEPKSETSQLISTAIEDEGHSAADASADMQFASAVAELGMLLRDSPYKGRASYADVRARARAMRGEDLEGYRDEFLRMVDAASALQPVIVPVATIQK